MSESFNIHMLYQQINSCALYFQVGLRAGRILIGYVWEWGRWAGARTFLALAAVPTLVY